ncbi:MAG: radical SAM protein, partial [Acidobacteria bacterium]
YQQSQILEGLLHAVERGLRLPLVHSTSAYDSPDSLALMNGIVDIYMRDFKSETRPSATPREGTRLSSNNRLAVKEMYRQAGSLLDKVGLR